MPIVTIYSKDGKKVRRPIGFTGAACNAATSPYEKREVPGSLKKDVTPEFFEDGGATCKVQQKQKAGS